MKVDMGLPPYLAKYFNKNKEDSDDPENKSVEQVDKNKEKAEKSGKNVLTFGGNPYAELMPEKEREKRDKRHAISKWISYFVLVCLLAVVASAGSWGLQFMAMQDYEFQLAEQESVEAMLAQYTDIADMFSERNRLNSDRENVMSTEIGWYSLIGDVENNLPAGSSLSNFTIAGGEPTSAESLDAEAFAEYMSEEEVEQLIEEAEAEEEQVAIVVLLTVTSSDPIDYSDIVSAIPGTTDAQLGNITNDGEGTFTYTVAFGFDEDTFVDRYGVREDDEEGSDENTEESTGEGDNQ